MKADASREDKHTTRTYTTTTTAVIITNSEEHFYGSRAAPGRTTPGVRFDRSHLVDSLHTESKETEEIDKAETEENDTKSSEEKDEAVNIFFPQNWFFLNNGNNK